MSLSGALRLRSAPRRDPADRRRQDRKRPLVRAVRSVGGQSLRRAPHFCSNRKDRAMAKRFSNLVAKMPKQARERARARTQAMAAELTLAELRKAFDVSQEELAKILD